ncbi:hypothetical protein BCR44DRAFT_1147070 [Catenaria anguillulae PL171]|uniref:Uncharacterized protein n=1 Tax=Catenaria anguillulae PL171 TaxID=765915 RepID=A0A1Y2HIX3_9FUNG|nr:hypothetical protein BCR44DRAFT_1147070 [Catenaria anguillulae PL171]
METKRARAKGKSKAARRAVPSKFAAKQVGPQKPSVVTPLVDEIRRKCSVFSKKIVAHGNANDFCYPPITPLPTDEIRVGAVVVVTSDISTPRHPPTNWLVRAMDPAAATAHLLKIVAGTETMVGTFADAGQHCAVPECRQVELKYLELARGASAPTAAVDTLFDGTAYIALCNVLVCPGGCAMGAASDPPSGVHIEHDGDAECNAIVQDWAVKDGFYEGIDCEGRDKVWLNDEWVFAYDYVFFAVDVDGNAILHDPHAGGASFRRLREGKRNKWAPQSSLYAIAQVIGIVEAESDDDSAAEGSGASHILLRPRPGSRCLSSCLAGGIRSTFPRHRAWVRILAACSSPTSVSSFPPSLLSAHFVSYRSTMPATSSLSFLTTLPLSVST